MRTCVLRLDCSLPRVLCFLPRLTVLLPALPDVHLSAQREVHVQPPVLLQLGERGHIRLRHTPHNLAKTPKHLNWSKSVWPKSGQHSKTLQLAKVGLANVGQAHNWPK